MGRLKELEYIIKNSTIIKFNEEGVISAGSRVTFIDEGGKEYTKQFVYPAEVDPQNDKISLEAPVGKAFLGKKENESVVITLPSGKAINYIIIKITNKND
jgi:transcription elongation GreA/GreB family factor